MAARLHAVMLAPAVLCLAAGLYGGLARMGVLKPFFHQPLLHHGSLMVVGFLAALIALERYFGGRSRTAALASGCFSLGGLALVSGELTVNRVLWAVGGVSFLAWACLTLYRFRTHFSTIFFTASAAILLTGVYLYIQGSPSKLYSFAWSGFLTTFIAGERMDMLKIVNAPKSDYFLAGASIPLTAVGIITVEELFMAAAFVSIFLTALHRDIAVKFIWKKGFSRYLGVGLSTAYAWLMTAAVSWALKNPFDSILHAVFLGFTATMIFTHAPIILPTILRVPHFYSPHLYIPFAMLQGSTVLRLAAGAAHQSEPWSLSGWITFTSVLTFAAVALTNVLRRKSSGLKTH